MSDLALKAPVSKTPNLSASFEELLRKLEEELARLPCKALGRFCFCFDGLNFDVRHVEQEGIYRFLISATIGYIPFSIESDARREAIKTIVGATRTLPKVRFDVDMGSLISASALYDVPLIVPPDFMFYPLTLFIQEARPFIDLIGKYLLAPTPASAPKQSASPAGVRS